MPDEVEGKLIITGAGAAATYEAIGRLNAIAGFRVAQREVELISDAYFDGPERPLFAVRLALRVRNLNGREKLTIKGDATEQDGVLSRPELEVDWSPEGFDEVLETLSQAEVSLGDVEAAREQTGAREALEVLGFSPRAPRENRRVALSLERDGEVVAEVAVDAVRMTAGERTVRHYEVECESKGAGGAAVIRSVLSDLVARFDSLRAWSISKLDLGEALQALEEDGRLAGLLDGERMLPAAYEAVETLMSQSRGLR